MVELRFSYYKGHPLEEEKENWEKRIKQGLGALSAKEKDVLELSGGLDVIVDQSGELDIKPYQDIFDEELRKAIEELKKAIKDW